ncbi:YkvA family protein [Flavobacterium facile]|uniref:YkvA family protein n=1 Tax=Flavobacterium facile TaxID=2893174 RepID=UPI002E7A3A21|nr:YkvA family protein [Flavobacterium sp. T-12]
MSKVEDKLNQIEKSFKSSEKEAEILIKDKQKTTNTVNEAMDKASKHKNQLEKVWDYLQLFFSIVKDYINGNYKVIPLTTIISIVASLLYLISPIDFIPDFIPGIGLIDDVFVIGLVISSASSDLDKYKQWKENKSLV